MPMAKALLQNGSRNRENFAIGVESIIEPPCFGPHNKTAYSRPKWSQHGVYGRDAGLGSRGRIYRLCPNGPLLQVSGGTQKPLPLPQVSRVFSLCRSS